MKTQPLDGAIAMGTYAHQIIQQNFQSVVDQEKAVLQDQDPEPLHQMRVGMRRLRTAVHVFGGAIALPKSISHPAIGKIAQRLGATRDLDVLQAALITHYQPLLQNAEWSKFNKVLKHAARQRTHSLRDLQKALKGDRYHTLKQALQHWSDAPDYTAMGDVAIGQILPDLLLPLVCQLFLHPGWLVGTTMQAGQVVLMPLENVMGWHQQWAQGSNPLHDLRKQIKGVRYQAEFFAGFYAVAYQQRIEEFKTLQDILGQLQDQRVLRQFVEATLQTDLAKVLPSVDRAMQQEQSTFWQSWQPLQQRYLASDFRQSLRSLLTTPLA
jgi:CHAD domain-containing protein